MPGKKRRNRALKGKRIKPGQSPPRREARGVLEAINRRRIAKDIGAGEKSRGVLASIGIPVEAPEIPEWIGKEVEAAEAGATPGTLPAVLLRQKEEKPGDALIVVRLSELVRHLGIKSGELGTLSDEEGS